MCDKRCDNWRWTTGQKEDKRMNKISCMELEIKNEELEQKIDDNNRRLEAAR